MAQENKDGVAYLKTQRGTGDGPATTAACPAVEPQPFAGPERRRSPRHNCEGSAEMREEGTDIRTRAAFKDISFHGCYLEAAATYPVGTVLHLKLEANGFQVQAKGIVRVTYPFLGMGIALTEMGEEDRARLRELLRTITHATVVMGAPLLGSGPLEPVPLISDPTAALRALVEFFEKR